MIEKSFNEILNHFKTELSISLENELIDWNKIIEIRERRHLIVHNSSIVNKKYISRTNNPYNFKIGDTIHIGKDYFLNSWHEFKIAGQLLLFNCWGNWDKDNSERGIFEIMNQTFEDLKSKNYNIVCKTCEYAKKIEPRNESQEDYLLRIKFNHGIALKKQKRQKELQNVLKSIKVGTAAPIFKIAYKILDDDHQGIEDWFTKAIVMDELNIDYYLEWPIFDFIKDSKTGIHDKLLATFK